MSPEEFDQKIRAAVEQDSCLTPDEGKYLLARYDEAVVNQNANCESLIETATMCREARHVAGLALAVLKATKHDENSEGIDLFVGLLEGKYPWLITRP